MSTELCALILSLALLLTLMAEAMEPSIGDAAEQDPDSDAGGADDCAASLACFRVKEEAELLGLRGRSAAPEAAAAAPRAAAPGPAVLLSERFSFEKRRVRARSLGTLWNGGRREGTGG